MMCVVAAAEVLAFLVVLIHRVLICADEGRGAIGTIFTSFGGSIARRPHAAHGAGAGDRAMA